MDLGKLLIIFGAAILILGVAFSLGLKFPRLPGDIYIQKENFTFIFPITTSILISIILTIIFNIFFRR